MSAASPRPGDTSKVLTYNAGWDTNGISWSRKAPYRLAVGSFVNEYSNTISIVHRDQATNSILRLGTLDHYYPPTKLLYSPAGPSAGVDDGRATDQLVTSGDYLRLWTLQDGPAATAATNTVGSHPDQKDNEEDYDEIEVEEDGEKRKKRVPKNTHADKVDGNGPTDSSSLSVTRTLAHTFRHSPRPNVSEDFCAPVTSFDWSLEDPRLVAASSIDTTVSLWDVETQEVTVHLIAHDKEVFDVAFQPKSVHVFATCGADGSVRVFDIRRMDHCTVVYENPVAMMPMMRVEWNRQDPNFLAAITAEGSETVLFDFRYPALSEVHLRDGHTAPVNSFAWAPHTASNLCTAGEDGRAVIWDTQETHRRDAEATSALTYDAGAPLNHVSWSALQTDWIAVSFNQCLQMLHI
jgi:WD repeat-containing protein 68